MAEIIENFEFKQPGSPYPWDEWLDGKIRLLQKGSDYHSQTESFRSTAQEKARARGLILRSQIQDNGLVIQAIKPEPVKPAAPRK